MRPTGLLSLLLLLGACKRDLDGDGQKDDSDCDDRNGDVFLGAPETCNGIDDDCDGLVDEGVSTVFFLDRDADGYGDEAFASRVCTPPANGVQVAGDCDDADAAVNPDALETCNGGDDDCDGTIDDVEGITYFADDDLDGHGAGSPITGGCVPEPGQSLLDDDCDDDEPLAWDGAPEACDGVDNDCNGAVDDGAPLGRVWEDNDRDGYGDPTRPALGCGSADGISDNDLDCDDADAAISPDAEDVQGNSLDEDCDGYVDEYGVPTPYATLDDALAAAPDGAVVQLDQGTFFGTVDLTGRDITLAGEGCDRTTLYADTGGTVVTADGGRVERLTLSGGTGTIGATGMTDGGALLVGGDVTASEVCFTDNDVTGRGGGAAVVAGTLTVLDSTFDRNFAADTGGGAWVGIGGAMVVRRSAFTANSALGVFGGGGGIGINGGTVDVAATVFAGNSAVDDGGGILVSYDKAGVEEPYVYTKGNATVRYATFYGNAVLGPNQTPRGQAIYNLASDLVTEYSIFGGHEGVQELIEDDMVGAVSYQPDTFDVDGDGDVVEALDADGDEVPDVILYDNRTPNSWSEVGLLFWDNGGLDYEFLWIWDALHEEVRYVTADPALPAAMWDLHLLPGSAGIDVGPELDPDGSLADLGAYGGPDAAATGNDSYTADEDGDGLEDGWERWGGTNPYIADANADADADGMPAGDERDADADPRLPDTDGDGALDPADALPRNPSDHRPLADAGLDRWTWEGTPVAIDGSGSWDPNQDALTFSWAIAAPGGSAVVAVDAPTLASTSFTPDVAGTYTLTLTVSDGAGTDTDVLVVNAGTGIRVPDDAPTVQAAVDAAADGGYVGVAPGTWTGLVDLGGKNLTILGLGTDPGDVVLDGGGAGVVVRAGTSEAVALANLTITGGNGGADGGGIYANGGSVVLDRAIVRDNTATAGAGVHLVIATLTASEVLFSGNHALTEGGAVYSYDGDVTVNASSFLANIADTDGGGVWIDNHLNNTNRYYAFTNCLWQDNVSVEWGSAIYSAGLYSTVRMTVRNDTFVHNVGERTILLTDGTLQLASVDFWDDQGLTSTVAGVVGEGAEFTSHGTATGVPIDKFWGATVSRWDADVPILDPRFVRYDGDGLQDDLPFAGPGSPLIDFGLALFTDTDGSRSDAGVAGGPEAPRYLSRFIRDDDADGMSDGWEVWFGLDPAVDDSAGDADGDGTLNLDEYVAGTDP
jgi:predicted outer membrane repeat protein